MAFWLVYQGSSFRRARAGGYMWAPKRDKAGRGHQHWANLTLVRSGDTIFSGVNNAVRAVSHAPSEAYEAARPDPKDAQLWDEEGWRLDVAYTDLPEPLPYATWFPHVSKELLYPHSPFSSAGRPNQGYFYALPNSVGQYLLELTGEDSTAIILEAAEAAPPLAAGETVRDALVKARVGQGQFRKDLMRQWGNRCPLSAVARPELLRASHIKPWTSCNNHERLDPNNGLLLSVAYDAAFDACLISFDDDGALLLAADFTAQAATAAGIDTRVRLPKVSAAMQPYLGAHRDLMAARVSRLKTV